MSTSSLREKPLPEQTFKALQDLIKFSQQNTEAAKRDWALFSIKNNTRIWQLKDRSNGSGKRGSVVLKSHIIIRDASPKSIVECITSVDRRFEWDCLLSEARIISKNRHKGTELLYLAYHPHTYWSWPRDYELHQYVHPEAATDSYYVALHSADPSTGKQVVNSTHVRGTFHWAGFIVQPWKMDAHDPLSTSIVGASSLTFICSAEFGGLLDYCPSDVAATFLQRHMQCVNGIALLMEDTFSTGGGKLDKFVSPKMTKQGSRGNVTYPNHDKKPLFDDDPNSPNSVSAITPIKQEKVEDIVSNGNLDKRISIDPRKSVEKSPTVENKVESKVENKVESKVENKVESKVEVERKEVEVEHMKNVDPQWISKLDAKALDILQLSRDQSDDWKTVATINDILITKKDTPEGLIYIRGQGLIQAPLQTVADCIADSEKRHEWDESLKEAKVLTRMNPVTSVNYMAYNAPWPVTPRDFVILAQGRHVEGSIVIASFSIDYDTCPPKKGLQRAELLIGGYLLTPVTNGTEVIYVQFADLKGNLPTKLVNQANQKLPLCIDGVRKWMTKRECIRSVSSDAQEPNMSEEVGRSVFVCSQKFERAGAGKPRKETE
ncbi:hypothetical protein PROFUN_02855 [Planoprotostelium fungivorum]|uniref:START domain-containing protein n=1 Tax=Planoprotostelium fungivorum TaxID=1890364 RepID=A0A2P6NRX6_9EUKA|nr:hypothetical protein PROFUN_02855 [Planoprotostelium fungivorum]